MSKAMEFKQHTYTPNEFYDYIKQIEDAMSGDIAISISPTTLGSSAAKIAAAISGSEQKFIRTITIKLVNTAGKVHEWFNGSLSVTTTETTAGSGTSAIEGDATVIELVKGIGTVNIEYTGTWAAEDTNTVTVGKDSSNNLDTIIGYPVTAKTSIDTVIA